MAAAQTFRACLDGCPDFWGFPREFSKILRNPEKSAHLREPFQISAKVASRIVKGALSSTYVRFLENRVVPVLVLCTTLLRIMPQLFEEDARARANQDLYKVISTAVVPILDKIPQEQTEDSDFLWIVLSWLFDKPPNTASLPHHRSIMVSLLDGGIVQALVHLVVDFPPSGAARSLQMFLVRSKLPIMSPC